MKSNTQNIIKQMDTFIKKKCKNTFKDIYGIVAVNVFNEEEYLIFTTTKKEAEKIVKTIIDKVNYDFNLELKIKKISGKLKSTSILQVKKNIVDEGDRFNKGMNPFE